MGSKRKFWFGEPGSPRRLFKYGRPAHGEDWAEKIAGEIAERLSIPHAAIELASCDGEPGIVTIDFRHDRGQLIHGNELLMGEDPAYPAGGSQMLVRQHTVNNVMTILARFGLPETLQSQVGLADAADAFVGYLLLDGLIGNTDRHHENWAILQTAPGGSRRDQLAPTFDHASSLGREVTDKERLARLDGRDRNRTVERYVERARGRFFRNESDDHPLSPIAAFGQAAAIRTRAASVWVERLTAVSDTEFEDIVLRVPSVRMSETARRFALRMLQFNQSTLVSGVEHA